MKKKIITILVLCLIIGLIYFMVFTINSEITLSDAFELVDESEVLYQYSSNQLENLNNPEYILYGNSILLYETDYSESEESFIKLVLINLSTNEITALKEIECGYMSDLRVIDDYLMICDSGEGHVYQLDDELEIINDYELDANNQSWYVGNLETIYKIDENNLIKVELNGEEKTILSSNYSLYGLTRENNGVNISYVDDEEMSQEVWLDLDSGEISEAPFENGVNSVSYYDETWVASALNGEDYYISTDDLYVTTISGSFSLINDAFLYYNDVNTLSLYDASFELISSIEVPTNNMWVYGQYCQYSDIYKGYFLLVYGDEGTELYFWDCEIFTEGDSLSISLMNEEITYDQLSTSLYDRVEEMSENYGLTIKIGDMCDEIYDDFEAEQVLDEEIITESLDILEEALSIYPENFLSKLKYNKISGIEMNMMGTLTSTNSSWGSESYSAFTQEEDDHIVIVFDMNQLVINNIYHELSHVIDRKLDWDASCNGDGLFSEETWSSLNPDDFEYQYTYGGFSEWTLTYDEYFVDAYSMISPTEDRARILEYGMLEGSYDSSYLQAKLDYYCDCIIDVFDLEESIFNTLRS